MKTPSMMMGWIMRIEQTPDSVATIEMGVLIRDLIQHLGGPDGEDVPAHVLDALPGTEVASPSWRGVARVTSVGRAEMVGSCPVVRITVTILSRSLHRLAIARAHGLTLCDLTWDQAGGNDPEEPVALSEADMAWLDQIAGRLPR